MRQTDIDKIRYPELVMKLARTKNGIISKKDVIDLLHIPSSQAYTILRHLQNDGKLQLLYGGKYAKYQVIES